MTDLAELVAAAQANLRAAQEMSDRATGLAAELSQLTGSAHSDDEEVAATVDHRGIVTGLTFSDDATDLGPQALGALVISTVQAAIGDLQSQAAPLRQQHRIDLSALRPDPALEDRIEVAAERAMKGSTTPENTEDAR